MSIAFTGRDYVRQLARERDGHMCQSCGLSWDKEKHKRRFHVHHTSGMCGKIGRGYEPISNLDILITLCPKCHSDRHDRSKKDIMRRKSISPNCLSNKKKVFELMKVGLSNRQIRSSLNLTAQQVRYYTKNLEGKYYAWFCNPQQTNFTTY